MNGITKDARVNQTIHTQQFAERARNLAYTATDTSRNAYDSTCHPGITELSGRVQQKAYELNQALRATRQIADELHELAMQEYLLACKLPEDPKEDA